MNQKTMRILLIGNRQIILQEQKDVLIDYVGKEIKQEDKIRLPGVIITNGNSEKVTFIAKVKDPYVLGVKKFIIKNKPRVHGQTRKIGFREKQTRVSIVEVLTGGR